MPHDSKVLMPILAWIGGCTVLVIAWNVVTSVEFLRIVLWPFTPILARMQTGEIDNMTALTILMVLGCVVGVVAAVISMLWPKSKSSRIDGAWMCPQCGHRYTDPAATAAHVTACLPA